ncbi:uncharacterized protein LOC8284427 [Ricinus communis]|uniref:Uncharacterized protein n=1 Tax=Ricinus communis TaxID=3988 RepID=B9RLN3_RICCO|nr:uncharacterized protein LOC8284427 [Ricinus communis]EEF47758.1 conserved hypothetical protein [Ricinus communis]|eukprot:XP_002514652.1 uncharacterized protein LOC8284427 [Ricinus communis]
MGPPEAEVKPTSLEEAKQTFSAMESGHQSGTREGLTIETATNSGEKYHTAHGKTLSSSSSASSSSSGSPFELDITNNRRLCSIEIASPNDTRLASEEYGYPVTGHETHPSYILSSNSESPTQSPPTQMMMEPPADSTPSGYRIPSSVFARKSSAPTEWSVASNESLFSIHMGNMSFPRDHANWFGKSGELGLLGDPPMSPMVDFSNSQYMSNQPPTNNPPESGQQNVGVPVDAHFGVTESKAAETMREVIKENEADHANKENTHAKRSQLSASFRRSDVSGASVTSFAFPILTGDHKGDPSSQKQHGSPQPQTPKVAQEQELQQKSHLETTKPETNANNQSKWFSCFPCCPSCS